MDNEKQDGKTMNKPEKRKQIDQEETKEDIDAEDLDTIRKVVCVNCGNYLEKFVGISGNNLVILICEHCQVLQSCGKIDKIKMKLKDN